jgi:hypothetical protein
LIRTQQFECGDKALVTSIGATGATKTPSVKVSESNLLLTIN